MKGRVIVTGATGFLGEYVIKELVANQYDVIAVGRNEQQLLYLAKRYGVKSVVIDLANRQDVTERWPEAEWCLHCAALSTIYGPYQSFYEANVLGTQHVIEASIAAGLKRVVFVSSPSIYGKCQDDFKIKETPVAELVQNKVYLNHYIRSKVEAEKLLQNYMQKIEIVIIRPRGLFGIGDTSIFPRLMAVNQKIGIPLFRQGRGNVMDITCVENVAYALRLCLEVSDIHQAVFNITNDEPVAFKVLMERIFELLGSDMTFRPLNETCMYRLAALLEGSHQLLKLKGEPLLTRYTVSLLAYSQTLDISAAKERLGYRPRISLDDGIKQYIENLKKGEN